MIKYKHILYSHIIYMIENIYPILNYVKYITLLFFFSYTYHYFYKKCNIQKKIKKNNKTKIVNKPKIILGFIYFILNMAIFYFFSFKIVFFIICIIIMGSLLLFDKLSPKLEESLEIYDRIPMIRLLWKIFSTILTLIYICTGPINKFITNFIKDYLQLFKNLFNNLINTNNDPNEINNEFKMNLNDINELSNFSEYIMSSGNKKNRDKFKNKDKIKTDNLNSSIISSSVNNKKSNHYKLFNKYNSPEKLNNNLENLIEQLNNKLSNEEELINKSKDINNIFENDNISDIEEITISENKIK